MPKTKAPVCNELFIRNLLRTDIRLRNLVKVDTFTQFLMLHSSVPRPGINAPKPFEPRPWRDEDTTAFIEYLIGEGFDKVDVNRVERAIRLHGWTERHSSAKDALDALPDWDGNDRLDSFWMDVCGALPENDAQGDYLRMTARCFFIGICRRILDPGCKLDTMLILEGEQGIGKSMLMRAICLDEEWFSDNLPHNIKDKDAQQHLPGKLILEWSEITQFRRSEVESVKSFISRQEDRYRPSYGRHEVNNPRQCVFVGTTNQSSYLKDETGNRRFWPVRCTKIDLALAKSIISQVYAEALHYAYQNVPHWFDDPALIEAATVEQRERLEGDVWEETVANLVNTGRQQAVAYGQRTFKVTTVECLTAIFADEKGNNMAKWGKADESRVGIILAKLGGIRRQTRDATGKASWHRWFGA